MSDDETLPNYALRIAPRALRDRNEIRFRLEDIEGAEAGADWDAAFQR